MRFVGPAIRFYGIRFWEAVSHLRWWVPSGAPRPRTLMVFTKRLREGVRRGRIRCSIRIWMRPKVKVGGRYPMDDGEIEVDSIESIELEDITDDLARESGFADVKDLLAIAKHGRGENVYLIRFHYLPPGAWPRTTPGRRRERAD